MYLQAPSEYNRTGSSKSPYQELTEVVLSKESMAGFKLSRVVPAILTDDPKTLESMIRQAESFSDYVQFDIMDGRFVPSQSITYRHLAALALKLKWEAHLMVERPEDYLEGFQQAGALKVIFHYEAAFSPEETIAKARRLNLQIGLALNPETPVTGIQWLTPKVDSVLILSVHPGFYGRQFIPEVLEKVIELRATRPGMQIGIDGGIKESNIAVVAQAGVDVIYVGSAIFSQSHLAESFRRLMALAEEGLRQRKG